MLIKLLGGLWVSAEIFAVTLVFSLILGLLVCFGRRSRCKILSAFCRIYISVLRGTPLMLQLLVVYFGPYYLLHMQISYGYRLIAVFIGFVLNYAAYFAEIYRSGIESISVGQWEAAQILGYTRAQTFFHIIFPQVVKRILPPVCNETITLVKDTSLAFAITVTEMFTLAKQIAAANTTMLPFVIAGVFYYVFNLLVAFAFHALEKKLSYYNS